MEQTNFAERAETVLIGTIIIGIVLVAQSYSIGIYRLGLALLVASTLLQIAVGNVPKHLGFAATAARVVLILALVAGLFCLGILLVPYFAKLGR